MPFLCHPVLSSQIILLGSRWISLFGWDRLAPETWGFITTNYSISQLSSQNAQLQTHCPLLSKAQWKFNCVTQRRIVSLRNESCVSFPLSSSLQLSLRVMAKLSTCRGREWHGSAFFREVFNVWNGLVSHRDLFLLWLFVTSSQEVQ